MKRELTQVLLREYLSYDPETGVFRWIKRPSNRVKVGDVAGCKSQHGDNWYVAIGVCGWLSTGHRLAWLYMTGELPEGDVDHKDCDGLNNAWSNLRKATRGQNNMNSKAAVRNKFGFKGVSRQAKSGRYMVRLGKKYLGTFDTPEEAHRVRVAAATERYGEFARAS